MAKIHIKRLQERFGIADDEIKGMNYRTLASEILRVNNINMAHTAASISKSNYQNQLSKLKPEQQSKFILPEIKDSFPKNQINIIKTADKENKLNDSLEHHYQSMDA